MLRLLHFSIGKLTLLWFGVYKLKIKVSVVNCSLFSVLASCSSVLGGSR